MGIESWLRILLRMWNALGERNLGLISAGVAFFALLAIFPGVAALIALWGFLSDPSVIEAQLDLLEEFVPEEGLELLSSQVDRLIETNESALGLTTTISIIATIWSARLGVGALMQGLNAAHGKANRGGIGHIIAAMVLTVALIVVGLVAMASIVILPLLLAIVPLGGLNSGFLLAGNWIVAIFVVVGGISLIYRYGPNHRPRTPWLSAGLALAVALWAVASIAFSWFLTNFGNYNEVYGSIAAVIALLMWFYISAYAILLGGLLNAEIDRERIVHTPSAP